MVLINLSKYGVNMICYKSGYKYQLCKDYKVYVCIKGFNLKSKYLTLSIDGYLTISDGYAWDGPSGPTVDTKSFMRGSLIHNALYQLMRENLLPRRYRKHADKLLIEICKEDGMTWIRRQWVYAGVRIPGNTFVSSKNRKKLIVAP